MALRAQRGRCPPPRGPAAPLLLLLLQFPLLQVTAALVAPVMRSPAPLLVTHATYRMRLIFLALAQRARVRLAQRERRHSRQQWPTSRVWMGPLPFLPRQRPNSRGRLSPLLAVPSSSSGLAAGRRAAVRTRRLPRTADSSARRRPYRSLPRWRPLGLPSRCLGRCWRCLAPCPPPGSQWVRRSLRQSLLPQMMITPSRRPKNKRTNVLTRAKIRITIKIPTLALMVSVAQKRTMMVSFPPPMMWAVGLLSAIVAGQRR